MRTRSIILQAPKKLYSPLRTPSYPRPILQSYRMSTSTEANIENTNINTATGVNLDDTQKMLVGSVLDLFAGRPSLKKLALWTDDAVFEDPLARAIGRKQYEAQWYGLQAAFSEIERLSHEVTSSGNPIELDMKTRYVIKGIGKEQVIESKINIFTEAGRITKVQDKWDGKLPDGSFTETLRRLNAKAMPTLVSVPKNDEEDAKKGNQ